MSAEYLLCSRCPRQLAVTEETFFDVAADWKLRFEHGRVTEVICPNHATPRTLRRPADVDEQLREVDGL